MVWCEGDVPKLERYVLEASPSFRTSTRIRTKSLETNLQIANCYAVTNRTIHNDSGPTIAAGKARLKIPAGTQSHKIFRLRNQGIVNLRGGNRGDLHVRIVVETPTNLSARQRELLEEMEHISDQDSHPLRDKFMNTIKGFFS